MAIRPAPSLLELLLPTALADTLLWSPVPRPATPSTLRTSTVTDTQQTEEFLIGLPDNVVVFAPSTTTPVISSMGRVLKTTPGSAEVVWVQQILAAQHGIEHAPSARITWAPDVVMQTSSEVATLELWAGNVPEDGVAPVATPEVYIRIPYAIVRACDADRPIAGAEIVAYVQSALNITGRTLLPRSIRMIDQFFQYLRGYIDFQTYGDSPLYRQIVPNARIVVYDDGAEHLVIDDEILE